MTRGGLEAGGGKTAATAGLVWHEPVSGTPTNKDKTVIEDTLRPVLEAVKIDPDLELHDLVGLSQQLDTLYFYRQPENDILALPVEDGTLNTEAGTVVCDSPDCRAAAVQILGVEKLAWVHPDLTDVV